MSTEVPQLNCLVYATQAQHHRTVSTWLGFSKRVGSVTSVESDNAVAKYLASASSDLAIVVVSDNSQSLPVCLQQYPELPVLVLTETKELRDLSEWYQQGATDVVSIQNTVAVQHAISRLIDERTLKRKLSLLDQKLQDSQLQIRYLKQILEKDLRFPSHSQTQNWFVEKQSPIPNVNKEPTVALRTIKGRYNFTHIDQTNFVEPAQASSIASTNNDAKPNTRKKLLDRFSEFLQSNSKSKRYTALLVRVLNHPDGASVDDSKSKSQAPRLQSVVRALKTRLHAGTVMGQLNDNALLIVQDTDKENTSRDTAKQVRALLGSLEGITDVNKEVRINTLTMRNSNKVSVAEAVERLESL